MRDPRLSVERVGGWLRPGGESAPAPLTEGAQLVAVAHGSKDPRAAATVHSLLGVVAERARARALADGAGGSGGSGCIGVRAAFLDHCAPSLPQVLGSLSDGRAHSCVVVPLLLTAAYHSKSDIPAQLAAASVASAASAIDASGAAHGVAVRCAATLGPHPLLLAALERRLREAGVPVDSAAGRARTAVVLAAAGSSDPAANATIADLAAAWQRDRGWRAVIPAYASAAGPSPAEAVTALGGGDAGSADGTGPVVVASYLLAPGFFADKIRTTSLEAGASAVSGVLGAAPEVADVVLARYREALCERLRADTGYAERAIATPRLVTCSIRGNPRGTDLPARAPRRA
jgi:sirohydrochlorin ferrochelatase